MSRATFLLISGVYSSLAGLSQVFMPEASFKSYGALTVDLSHIATLQYLGVAGTGLGILTLMNRHLPNSPSLRNVLLILGLTFLGTFLKGLYDIFILQPPMSAFLIGDTFFRLMLGLAHLYYYNRETRLAVR